ncbi:hypothetical protein C0J52_25375 [Blattella germanica]|nr:hypothetical protein C0J52_25375 [Blattella germanica]
MAERSSRWDVNYFASCTADALMEMLCNTYLQDNLKFAEDACKDLKHCIHDLLPRSLTDVQSEQIFDHVSQIEDEIKHFDHLPWYRNVLELFGESVIHPDTSTIWYKPNSGKLSVQYFTGHLVKKRTLKAFIFKESKAKTVCNYQWQPRNKTFRSIMKMIEREKKLKSERRWRANQCERPETRELLLQICKEDEDRAAAAKTPELKLKDFIHRLDALQVFVFPILCNYDYLSITSLATLRIVDVSFSRFITNASVPLLKITQGNDDLYFRAKGT